MRPFRTFFSYFLFPGFLFGTVPQCLQAADPVTDIPLLQPGPYEVGKQDFTLVDHSRITPAHNNTAELDERILKTSVWYPAQPRDFEWLRPGPAPLALQAFPAPLVIYSHGFMSFRGNGAYLASYLASHGYIVAAADFPLTNFSAPDGPRFTDVINQPGDVSYIIDTLLSRGDKPENRFSDHIDSQRIAAMGLSLGGITTTLLVFHSQFRDPRIQAGISIAGPVALLGKDFFTTPPVPFMMIAGDIDAMIDYRLNALRFRAWVPEATLVTLHGASHTGFAGMADPVFRWFDNPDSPGCWAMRSALDDAIDMPEDFAPALRGRPNEKLTELELVPCRHMKLPVALRPRYQQTLTKQAVLAFLQSRLHPDAAVRSEYRKILEQSLAQEYPEVTVSSGQ